MKQAMQYMGLLMVIIYVLLGAVIIGGYDIWFSMPTQYALPTGLVLICYGLFRAYRIALKFGED